MKCPACSNELHKALYKGIEVEECGTCGGKWFEEHEVDKLEDTVFDQDEFKNTLITNEKVSDRKCPIGGEILKKFHYRWEDLELEYCPNGHGYWLDKEEEMRVLEILEEHVKDMERKFSVEEEWTNKLKEFQSPSLFSKLKNFFK